MRAVHLCYHEVTEDPRVLKECLALANSGVEIVVACAQNEGTPERECIGLLDVHRFPWMQSGAITLEYIESLRQLKRSYPYIEQRFAPFLETAATYKAAAVFSDDIAALKTRVLGSKEAVFDTRAYKKLKGWKRLIRKLRGAYVKRNLVAQGKRPEFSKSVDELRSLGFGTPELLGEPYARFETGVINVVARHSDLFQAVSFLFDANLRALGLSGPIDIVHAHDIYTLPAGVALAQRFGAKLIYDAHEFETARASKMPPEGNAMANAIELDCLEYVDALITVSDGLRDLYSKRFIKDDPLVVLNAPDITWEEIGATKAPQDRVSFRKELGVPSETPLLAYTGWVQKSNRGLNIVAQALTRLPHFHLVVLGPRHERDDKWLLDEAARLGVADRIHLLPPVHHTEVVPTIRNCDVSIIPIQDATLSYRHAMPNKLLEGALSGLPVCVSDLPDMRAFIEATGRGKTMNPTDGNSIAEAISDVYTNRSDYELTDIEHREFVEKYNWSAQADKLKDLYSTL